MEALKYVLFELHDIEDSGADKLIVLWSKGRRAKTLDEMKAILEEIPTGTSMSPVRRFAKFMNGHESNKKAREIDSEGGPVTKNTLDGDPETPEKTTTLPAKRSAGSI